MTFRIRSSVGPAILVCAAASLFGGSAAAVEPAKKGTIKGCYKKKSGSLRVLVHGKRCKRGERSVAWSSAGAGGSDGGSGQQGPPGPMGPAGLNGVSGIPGLAGPPGSAGSTGATGPTGPVGPSTAREAVNTGSTSITGGDAGSGNSLATLPNVPSGDYLLTARVQLNSAATTTASIVCRASLGSKSAVAIADIGSDPNSVDHVPITITFNTSLASTGSANVKCWHDSLTGGAPTASDTYLEVLTVGSASSTSVTS
jgi:hypothetical protein